MIYSQSENQLLCDAHEGGGNGGAEDEEATIDVQRHEGGPQVERRDRDEVYAQSQNQLLNRTWNGSILVCYGATSTQRIRREWAVSSSGLH